MSETWQEASDRRFKSHPDAWSWANDNACSAYGKKQIRLLIDEIQEQATEIERLRSELDQARDISRDVMRERDAAIEETQEMTERFKAAAASAEKLHAERDELRDAFNNMSPIGWDEHKKRAAEAEEGFSKLYDKVRGGLTKGHP